MPEPVFRKQRQTSRPEGSLLPYRAAILLSKRTLARPADLIRAHRDLEGIESSDPAPLLMLKG